MRITNFILMFFVSIAATAQEIHIIPQPVSVKKEPGFFRLSKKTVIAVTDEGDRKAAEFFNDYLMEVYGFRLDIDRQEGKDYIRLNTRKFIKAPEHDAYTLNVGKEGVTIEGDTYAGTFHGVQTLIQLLPVVRSTDAQASFQIPQVAIQDQPRFKYRGMHLDVARHFFPVSFVKRYIDYLALHKLNYFHWHLTDDQGWRIEIKKYPELMSVAAWRNGTIIGRFPGKGNDNTRHGGYYTQEEVRDIIQYAANRHITVVPEIEMPGHASAAIAAFPYLSCFPEEPTVMPRTKPASGGYQGIKKVQETWGVFDDVFCAGNDSTFSFLEGVMDEVVELFPSTYIHVGGDECPKTHWRKCPKCQARMKTEGLKNVHELQSWFIQKMERYLNAKGKTIIGWDEILEGGLAPNAIVMSWRGEKGGIEAAKQKHQVIMTPQKPVYFDHSQKKKEDSVTIGGYNPIENVYSYEPVPKELKGDVVKYVLGAQANLWTEYIEYPSKVEYMIFPRLSALSEVLWSPKEIKNWKEFEKKLPVQFQRYELWKANYSKTYFQMNTSVVPGPGGLGIAWKIESKRPGDSIMFHNYVIQDKDCIEYKEAIQKKQLEIISVKRLPYVKTIKCSGDYSFVPVKGTDQHTKQAFQLNLATGKKITLKNLPSSEYAGDGAFTLVNGVVNKTGLQDASEFLGFKGGDLVATIDLGSQQTIRRINLSTLHQPSSWIYRPSAVSYFSSNDGKNFKKIDDGYYNNVSLTEDEKTFDIGFMPRKTRYIRVVATNHGVIPDGQPGAGNRSWLFADEIQVW
jgi:hexosaminidase